eukprot:gene7783-15922_t
MELYSMLNALLKVFDSWFICRFSAHREWLRGGQTVQSRVMQTINISMPRYYHVFLLVTTILRIHNETWVMRKIFVELQGIFGLLSGAIIPSVFDIIWFSLIWVLDKRQMPCDRILWACRMVLVPEIMMLTDCFLDQGFDEINCFRDNSENSQWTSFFEWTTEAEIKNIGGRRIAPTTFIGSTLISPARIITFEFHKAPCSLSLFCRFFSPIVNIWIKSAAIALIGFFSSHRPPNISWLAYSRSFPRVEVEWFVIVRDCYAYSSLHTTESSPNVAFSDKISGMSFFSSINQSPRVHFKQSVIQKIEPGFGNAYSGMGSVFGIVKDVVRSLPRSLKAITSSKLESILLLCTMPSNRFMDESKVSHLLSHIGSFDELAEIYGIDAYDVIVRKLIAKMRENDWRTVAKAAHMLHRALHEISPAQRKVLAQHMTVPLEEIRIILQRRLQKDKQLLSTSSSDDNELTWGWVLKYTNHLESIVHLYSRDITNIQDSLQFHGPHSLLQSASTYLSISNNILSSCMQLQTKFSTSPFIREITGRCDALLAKDITYILTTVASLDDPVDGGFTRMEQGVVDELQRLATDVRNEVIRTIALRRELSTNSNNMNSNNINNNNNNISESPRRDSSSHVMKLTHTGWDTVQTLHTAHTAELPPLPGWIHDLTSMQARKSLGPLRMRGGGGGGGSVSRTAMRRNELMASTSASLSI